MENKKTIL